MRNLNELFKIARARGVNSLAAYYLSRGYLCVRRGFSLSVVNTNLLPQ